MWDTYYGKQNNPYGADDFRRILAALKASPERDTPEMQRLIERTQEALETETEDDD
jgi:hypothetical protein